MAEGDEGEYDSRKTPIHIERNRIETKEVEDEGGEGRVVQEGERADNSEVIETAKVSSRDDHSLEHLPK